MLDIRTPRSYSVNLVLKFVHIWILISQWRFQENTITFQFLLKIGPTCVEPHRSWEHHLYNNESTYQNAVLYLILLSNNSWYLKLQTFTKCSHLDPLLRLFERGGGFNFICTYQGPSSTDYPFKIWFHFGKFFQKTNKKLV